MEDEIYFVVDGVTGAIQKVGARVNLRYFLPDTIVSGIIESPIRDNLPRVMFYDRINYFLHTYDGCFDLEYPINKFGKRVPPDQWLTDENFNLYEDGGKIDEDNLEFFGEKYVAIRNEDFDIIGVYGINRNIRHGIRPLHLATTMGDSRAVENLIRFGVNLDAQDRLGETAAHDAARKGNTEILRMLENAGANLYIQNNKGYQPYDVANGDAIRYLGEMYAP